MKIAVGCDHMGFPLKPTIIELLKNLGHCVSDHGSFHPEPVDFPDIAQKVCADILAGEAERGIMVCGSGVGAAIACNKITSIRASVCHDIFTAHQCVEHDDVQVMCIGAQIIGPTVATELVEIFLKAKFSTSEEFVRRVKKLEDMDEQRHLK